MPDSISALSEFTLFPKLPPELRRTIWRYALPGGQNPRHVEIRAPFIEIEDSDGYIEPDWNCKMWKPFCPYMDSDNATVEEALLACHESRAEALRLQVFKGNEANSEIFYFDCSTDILCISEKSFAGFAGTFDHIPANIRIKLRHIYIDSLKLFQRPEWDSLPDMLLGLPNLHELSLTHFDDIQGLLGEEWKAYISEGKHPIIGFRENLIPEEKGGYPRTKFIEEMEEDFVTCKARDPGYKPPPVLRTGFFIHSGTVRNPGF